MPSRIAYAVTMARGASRPDLLALCYPRGVSRRHCSLHRSPSSASFQAVLPRELHVQTPPLGVEICS